MLQHFRSSPPVHRHDWAHGCVFWPGGSHVIVVSGLFALVLGHTALPSGPPPGPRSFPHTGSTAGQPVV
eukprot:775622-Alexandrium_andersonii.AAC.1